MDYSYAFLIEWLFLILRATAQIREVDSHQPPATESQHTIVAAMCPMTPPTAGPKTQRKTTTRTLSATFDKKLFDLTALFNHEVGRDDYTVFVVPADHQCLFHSLACILKLLYTTSRPPTSAEVRAAVITFYLSCPQRLRQFLEQQWPGVATLYARAQTMENNPIEWGEPMDIQAAAIFYDADIEVAIKTRTRQVYVGQVHSFNRDGRRSENAKKCKRIVYFDGRNHFKIIQKV